MECGVKCVVQSARREKNVICKVTVWSVECGLRSVECGVQSVKCKV